MLAQGFLYRRLAGLIPCALPDVAGGSLLLRNKWQISSARDVFMSSHYWRLFDHLDEPPRFIVDLGGHCGHFVVLSELVLEERFGRSNARYLVVEGMPELIEEIRATVRDTGLAGRCSIVHGLVGKRSGSAVLHSGRSNLLEASVVAAGGDRQSQAIPYVDLLAHLPEGAMVDVLKVDIEGSEYELVKNYPGLLERTRVCAMEVHEAGGVPEELMAALEGAGLKPCLPHIRKGPNLLVLYKREKQA